MAVICGIHAVEQALAAGRPAERLLVGKGRKGAKVEAIVKAARRASIPVRFVNKSELDRTAGSAAHQSVVLVAGAKRYVELENLIEKTKGDKPGLLVLLDGVQDPHNLGAILRTAVCAGADGVILPERRAAGVTPAAEKAAAGATEHIAIARVVNLNRAMEQLKEAGFWLVGFDAAGDRAYHKVDLTGPVGLVLGGEGKGLHEQVRKRCDFLVSIPIVGKVESLNVSVTAGVALYEVLRQRRLGG